MAVVKFTFGAVLQIVFKYISEPPSVLAEFYIDRDRTLVYKWLRDTASPSKKLVPNIVKFVCESTSEPMRVQIKNEIDGLICETDFIAELKHNLVVKEDFKTYLQDVFFLSIAQRKNGSTKDEKKAELETKHTTVAVSNIVFALLAPITGGFIWNIINNIARWQFYMGGSGSEPDGFKAFIWGLVTVLPIAVFAVLSTGKDPFLKAFQQNNRVVTILFYTLAGGIAGYIFYNSGFRSFIESVKLGYFLQEALIVFVYALVISILPLLAVLLLFRFPKIQPVTFLLLEFCPAIICVLIILTIVFIDLPEIETAQLRGFLVGFILKLLMFGSLRKVITGYPDRIQFETPHFLQKQL